METFKALRSHGEQGRIEPRLVDLRLDDLSPGEVVVRVRWSALNYKDALGLTGKGKVYRRMPIVGGIDLSGVVESSSDPAFAPGMEVMAQGEGTGESQDGGFAQFARVRAGTLMPVPAGLDAQSAVILGTAGFSAALAVSRMERNGQAPSMGPVVVTGASGGVGCFAVQLLAKRGYEVVAVSGKRDLAGWLKSLGASRVLAPEELSPGSRPLEAPRFAGAVDSLGGEVLAGLLRHMDLGGNVASVGLALSSELSTSVMPFILRGVSLLGVSSANHPHGRRAELWKALGGPLKPPRLAEVVTREVGLADLPQAARDMLARKTHGRVLVRLS